MTRSFYSVGNIGAVCRKSLRLVRADRAACAKGLVDHRIAGFVANGPMNPCAESIPSLHISLNIRSVGNAAGEAESNAIFPYWISAVRFRRADGARARHQTKGTGVTFDSITQNDRIETCRCRLPLSIRRIDSQEQGDYGTKERVSHDIGSCGGRVEAEV